MKKRIFKLVENNTFKLNESTHTYDTTITVVDPATDVETDVDVTVEYDYISEERGSREPKTGLPLSPDYPAEIEILSVTDNKGKEYDLTDDQADDITQEIFKHIETLNEPDDDDPDYY